MLRLVVAERLGPGNPGINLTQALKLANVIETGGLAKSMIADGMVKVNGEIETRKRRQLMIGDRIEVEGAPPIVVLAEGAES